MNKLLTIVVPVYKVEQYINKCLDSCILYKNDGSLDEEKMNQLEVIIVNDGTPDRSAELSRVYTVRFPQTFRQIDKENGGHGSAWNVGLKEATGKYLRFLDSDDWLTNLDLLMDKLVNIDTDLVFTPIKNVFIGRGEEVINVQDEIGVKKNILDFNFEVNTQLNIADFWYVTYKKEILDFNCDLFLEHCSYDDAVLFVAPFIKAKTYVVYDFIIYNYLLGRPEQSVSPNNMIRGVNMRLINHIHMHTIWDKYGKGSELYQSTGINEIFSNHIITMYSNLWLLPYFDYKKGMHYWFMDYSRSRNFQKSKVIKRYEKYPFFIFYFMEWIRREVLKR